MAFGFSDDDREIACVYEMIDDLLVFPIAAYYTD